ncbi:MAG: hypothetical protein ACRDTG_23080 [Pseudonocardiaceae bacterium]
MSYLEIISPVEGVAKGRAKAQDMVVRNQIILAVATCIAPIG